MWQALGFYGQLFNFNQGMGQIFCQNNTFNIN